tara:strand:- start:503 stop:808 length:306 start_codon:yes stop_codon:yes gene_type:complete
MIVNNEKTIEMRDIKKFINHVTREVWESVKLDEKASKGTYTEDSRWGLADILSRRFSEVCTGDANELHMIKEFQLDLDTGMQAIGTKTVPCACIACRGERA